MISDPVKVHLNEIRDKLGDKAGLKFLVSIRGFCDKKLGNSRDRHKHQHAYNKGYDG